MALLLHWQCFIEVRANELRPFDAAVCPGLTQADMDEEKIEWFLELARQERNLVLDTNTSPSDVLTHLKLVDNGRLTNAAALLFAKDPQYFRTTAVVKCAHYHGIEVAKPIPSYQVYDGTLFDQVDDAVNFVMSKLDRGVGTRSEGATAPVHYELPKAAVAELIVNAVAHRDYTSNASVQVSIFSDRIEVWNPGRLPPWLTPADLAKPHSSEPANPLIAHPLYLAHYIESIGTGTIDIIRLCRESDLPAPVFEQRGRQFVVTIWRDWLTEKVMDELGLNKRQKTAIMEAKSAGGIDNSLFRKLTGVSESTALRELRKLADIGIIEKVGATGRSTHYRIVKAKPVINPSNPSSGNKKQTCHKPVKPVTKKTIK